MTQKVDKKSKIGTALYNKRYFLPNLVTIGNLFCGFLAIIYASSGRFDKAVLAIFAGIILDGLDGRVARRFNASSDFGVQFDSLADLASFGVAPAYIMYEWCFKEQADEFGVMICFIFVLCEAARLARFNVSVADEKSKDFTGLPSPAAAAMIVSVINLFPSIDAPQVSVLFATLYMIFISYLMVSTIKYPSGKDLKLKNPLMYILIFGTVIAFLWYKPRITVFSLAAIYCLSGPAFTLPALREKAYAAFKKLNA